MNIETILTTVDYLEKLKSQSEDDTLDKLILFWKMQANQHEAPVINNFSGKIIETFLLPVWEQNGPSSNCHVRKIIKLSNGKYFKCGRDEYYGEIKSDTVKALMEYWDENYSEVYQYKF